jgi:hypothetical protein
MRERFLEAFLQRTERKLAGPGPRNGRRPDGWWSAGRRCALPWARTVTLPCEVGSPPASKGCLTQHPWRLPSLHPLAQVARGIGKPRTHCAARMRKCGCLNLWIKSSRRVDANSASCVGRNKRRVSDAHCAALRASAEDRWRNALRLLRLTRFVLNEKPGRAPGLSAH